MDNKIEWFSTYNGITDIDVLRVEKQLKIVFPDDYRQCIKKNHGGTPIPEVYDFYNHKEAVFNRLFSFNVANKNYIINNYSSIKDRLIDNIFPFADDPFGNCICFDYRKGNNKPPQIVFWDHEEAAKNPDNAIHYICDTFTDLLNKLYLPE